MTSNTINKIIMKKNIYSYLEIVRKRPWMYIWWNSINFLFLNLIWYSNCIWLNEIKWHFIYPNFHLFHEYVAFVYWIKMPWWMWWSTILEEHHWDNKEWVDKFFEHLDDFKELFWNMPEEEIIAWFDERGYDVRSRFDEKY